MDGTSTSALYLFKILSLYSHLPVSVLMPVSPAGGSEQPECLSASLRSGSKHLQQRRSGLESDSLSPSSPVCSAPDRSACGQSWTGNRTKSDQGGIREGERLVPQLEVRDLEITCNWITVIQGDKTAPHTHAGPLFTPTQTPKQKPVLDAYLIQWDDSGSCRNLAELEVIYCV